LKDVLEEYERFFWSWLSLLIEFIEMEIWDGFEDFDSWSISLDVANFGSCGCSLSWTHH
jgi:hypothetical protein